MLDCKVQEHIGKLLQPIYSVQNDFDAKLSVDFSGKLEEIFKRLNDIEGDLYDKTRSNRLARMDNRISEEETGRKMGEKILDTKITEALFKLE